MYVKIEAMSNQAEPSAGVQDPRHAATPLTRTPTVN